MDEFMPRISIYEYTKQTTNSIQNVMNANYFAYFDTSLLSLRLDFITRKCDISVCHGIRATAICMTT